MLQIISLQVKRKGRKFSATKGKNIYWRHACHQGQTRSLWHPWCQNESGEIFYFQFEFLLTVEFFCLQSHEVPFRDTSHCKQKTPIVRKKQNHNCKQGSSTVSRKPPTVRKIASRNWEEKWDSRDFRKPPDSGKQSRIGSFSGDSEKFIGHAKTQTHLKLQNSLPRLNANYCPDTFSEILV